MKGAGGHDIFTQNPSGDLGGIRELKRGALRGEGPPSGSLPESSPQLIGKQEPCIPPTSKRRGASSLNDVTVTLVGFFFK